MRIMTDAPSSDSGTFERYLGILLRPLARVLIARGIPAPTFYRLVKQAYVDAATDQMGAAVTDSRIAVATGVHRRDVKALRSEARDDGDGPGGRISLLATVLGKWMSDPVFSDQSGPRPLPRRTVDTPGFDALVHAVSRDVRPRTVLDELVSRGLVEVTEDTVVLSAEGLVGTGDDRQKTHFFAHNVGDHVSAAAENLLSDVPPHLERAVFYNRLTPASVERIEVEARALGLKALQEINTLAATCQDEDAQAANASHRIRFGVFFYKTDESAEDEGRSDDAED
jgi:hypothetical protein